MTNSPTILTGDIGGTHARFAYAVQQGGAWQLSHYAKFKGADYDSFDKVLDRFLSSVPDKPDWASISAAGPVKDGRVQLTNRDWHICTQHLQKTYPALKGCRLYNDFAAMTRSIPEMKEDDFTPVKSGNTDPDAPVLVAGAGTGFGVGYLLPLKSGSWYVITSEGGHQAYAPQTALECDLLKTLQAQHGFVSLEMVSSGTGLPAVHQALATIRGAEYMPLAPEVIRQKAGQGDALCLDICRIRAAAIMGALGDLALSGGTRGGVVIAGGVSERMIDFLLEPQALERFATRGPRSDYMADIPIRLLTSSLAPLKGAAALLHDDYED